MNTWIVVATAAHNAEAHILKGVLENAGFEVRLSRESLSSLGGAIPMTESRIDISVPEQDAASAREVLALGVEVPYAEAPADEASLASKPAPRSVPRWAWLVMLALAASTTWLAIRLNRVVDYRDDASWDDQERCLTYFWPNGRTHQRYCDRNGDGKIEVVTQTDRLLKFETTYYDSNHDMVDERVDVVDSTRRPHSTWRDADQSGIFESGEENHPDGLILRWRDANEDLIREWQEVRKADGTLLETSIYEPGSGWKHLTAK